MSETKQLPIRIVQNQYASLESFNDAYFEFLKSTHCTALYLQNSPFDPGRTGNVGQFYTHFHLMSLFDISRSYRAREYQDYINEICERAARHGIGVWLDCWEPRLPAYAQAMLPEAWSGRGGWGWHGDKHIAFCWEHPDGVAYWKSMAEDALNALPDLEGVIVGMIDNECSFCDESCPRCEGRSLEKGVLDVFSTFVELTSKRERPLKIAMYDWWMPASVTDEIKNNLPGGSLVIGRSARGMRFESPDKTWKGEVIDISNVPDGINESEFKGHCDTALGKGLVPIDMVAWSRGMENFFLPAPPDPLFCFRKMEGLAAAGAEGWIDYDCGNLEPGSIAEGMRLKTENPELSEEALLQKTLESLWGESAGHARPAYTAYREAKRWLPTGITSKYAGSVDTRCCGLGYCILAPYHLDDFRFYDSMHARCFFAPYNLMLKDSIFIFHKSADKVSGHLEAAWKVIREQPALSAHAKADQAAFEIHWRNFRAIRNYAQLGVLKLRYEREEMDAQNFQSDVREMAEDELENFAGIVQWIEQNPAKLGNPCHRLLGHLKDAYPSADFDDDIYAVKRRSLEFLRDRFDPSVLMPGFAIQGLGTDKILF